MAQVIRERREADFDRLCAILDDLQRRSKAARGHDSGGWLKEHDADQSWVFDMAPVRVAPTKNVVAHVQIFRPSPHLVEQTQLPESDVLAIGKLFVRPHTYEYGIGRYLVRESIRYIRHEGKIPILDTDRLLSTGFFERLGFQAMGSADGGLSPMIYAQ